MIPHNRKYFIIIVHYGSPEPTRELIMQLQRQTDREFVIIVVNQDDTRREYIIPSSNTLNTYMYVPASNLGYMKGIQFGIEQLPIHEVNAEDIIIACNNDLNVPVDAIAHIKQWWKHISTPTLATIQSGTINLWTGKASLNSDKGSFSLTRYPYLHGSCFLAPYNVWTNIFPSEDYFLYWEDVLLSQIARQKNYELGVIPDTGIKHNDSLQGLKSYQLYYLVRNGVHFLETKLPFFWRLYWIVKDTGRYIFHTLRRTEKSSLVRKAIYDGWKKQLGKHAI